jgi:hypothetical protein
MNEEPLCSTPGDLEDLLRRRVLPVPPPMLRTRVLSGVHGELRREQWRSRASFAAALAAAALLWINLSSSASLATVPWVPTSACWESSCVTAAQIRELLPEATPEEAARYAMVLRAGSQIPQCPWPARGMAAWKLAERL